MNVGNGTPRLGRFSPFNPPRSPRALRNYNSGPYTRATSFHLYIYISLSLFLSLLVSCELFLVESVTLFTVPHSRSRSHSTETTRPAFAAIPNICVDSSLALSTVQQRGFFFESHFLIEKDARFCVSF